MASQPMRRLAAMLLSAATVVMTAVPTGRAAAAADCASPFVVAPTPSENAHLAGVSVAATADVWAVGTSIPAGSSNTRTVAEHWDGSAWSDVVTPDLSQEDSGLNDVVAVAPGDVWAVGFQGISNDVTTQVVTLAEHWDGASWSVVQTPDVGSGTNLLASVTATSGTDVWAAGSYVDSTQRRHTLVEHWDGTAWSVIPTADVTTGDDGLVAISAIPGGGMWAVGYRFTDTGYRPLIERWNGTAWAIVAPATSGVANSALLSVTATSATQAWAVGYTLDGTRSTTLIERWNGQTWTIESGSDPGADVNVLRDVATGPGGGIWAAGFADAPPTQRYRALIERWDGTSWQVIGTPDTGGTEALASITVSPTGDLWTVGSTDPIGIVGTSPLAEQACGPVSTPTPSGTRRPLRWSPAFLRPRVRRMARSLASRSTGEPATLAGAIDVATPKTTTVGAIDAAATAGIEESPHTWSAAITDLNGDGWPDLFVGHHKDTGKLYLNEGGVFSEIDPGYFTGKDRHDCAWLDANGDGLQDLFCSSGDLHGTGVKSNDLEIQGAGLTFSEQTDQSGMADPFGRGRRIAVFDANGDGVPDVLVGNDPSRNDGIPDPNQLFLGLGNGTFRDAPELGLDRDDGGTCVVPGDVNGDGWTDVMVCTPLGLKVYENQGGKWFADATTQLGLTGLPNPNGAVFTDLNRDGRPDIAMVSGQRLVVLLQSRGTYTSTWTLRLTQGRGVTAGDSNADGRPDLYVTQGGDRTGNPPDIMLLNGADGTTFTQQPIPEVSTGCGDRAYPIDYDRNGLTDYLVLNGCGSGPAGPIQLIAFKRIGAAVDRPR